ncbi:MAG TPA: bifunctional glutamate N-acetyltransferase/amino-acid acetyltransferase ArgJ [Stellaceae bacterium]|nr:bifunctional glutamate N-acetyltransferase/amino-acid acetyltransferase ArgJ [Stellaceae bacterium]
MSTIVSPLAPKTMPAFVPLDGVRLGAVNAGIRYKTGRTDLMAAVLDAGTEIAGVFTRSKTPGAPIVWCRSILPHGKARAIVVNAGNANVFTGRAGHKVVEDTAAAVASILKCKAEEVYVSSTGVIGELPPGEKITTALPGLLGQVSADGWEHAARAIMTTDTFPKWTSRQATIGGKTVTIQGFCKGSGMIAPDMATMLCYVFTDAALPAAVLQTLLTNATDKSFNAITVDSDTSTSDTILLAATGKAGNAAVTNATDPALRGFRKALDSLLLDLAHLVVRDGEGAEKFVEIRVKGAKTAKAARRIGLSIGNSPLVKTALAAGDANWGRIVAAIGKSGEVVDRDTLSIAVGGITIAHEGGAVPGYDETPVSAHMAGQNIVIDVDIGLGSGKSTIWTCDLTHRYIDINGSYRS